MSQSPLIMILRHGEKPGDTHKGVSKKGAEDENSLIVRGWQRAGALMQFFTPGSGRLTSEDLQQPAFLFAICPEAPGAESDDQSRREEQTLEGLSKRFGVKLNLGFGKGQEAEVAGAAIASGGPVLIAWDHRKITELAKTIAPNQNIPDKWPSDRFDMIFALHLQPDTTYSFSQVPQLLLPGDTDRPIH